MLVEDDPYGLLRFEGEALPTLHELDGGDRVIYCSSFTKTVAPGVRTGYLVLPEPLVRPLAIMSEDTQIGPNTLAEAVLWAYCDAGRFEPNVARATEGLRQRRDAMEAALRAHFPDGSRWTTPRGGYFFWVTLPDGIDTTDALPLAAEQGVAYVKGADFFAGRGRSQLASGSPSAPARPIRSTRASPAWARCSARAGPPPSPEPRAFELTDSGSCGKLRRTRRRVGWWPQAGRDRGSHSGFERSGRRIRGGRDDRAQPRPGHRRAIRLDMF